MVAASSRSASATAGWRCISTDNMARLHRPIALARGRLRASPRSSITSQARCVVLRRAPRSGRWWLSRRNRRMRSGISCGRAPLRTTRSTRCARSRVRPNDGASGPLRSPAPHGDVRRATAGRPSGAAAAAPPSAEGRWSLVSERVSSTVTPTERSTALAQQLLSRYGVLTREVAAAEGIFGGFSAVYDVLKALEDAGRIRRGYFVERCRRDAVRASGGARSAAVADGAARGAGGRPARRNRSGQPVRDDPRVAGGAAKRRMPDAGRRGRSARSSCSSTARSPPTSVAAHASCRCSCPRTSPARSTDGTCALARRLAGLGPAHRRDQRCPGAEHPLAPFLVDAGFSPSAMGFHVRRGSPSVMSTRSSDTDVPDLAGRHA